MSKPSAETIETLRNIRMEIGAGMILIPKSDAERAYNIACDRANSIIFNYMEGCGLVQMVRDAEARRAKPDYGDDAEAAGRAEYERVTREDPK